MPRTTPPVQSVGDGWIAFVDQAPPNPSPKLLVTNNLRARNAHGFMSHLWLVTMAHSDGSGGWTAFDDRDCKIHSLSHWRFALPEQVRA